jgi:hypothetical protein
MPAPAPTAAMTRALHKQLLDQQHSLSICWRQAAGPHVRALAASIVAISPEHAQYRRAVRRPREARRDAPRNANDAKGGRDSRDALGAVVWVRSSREGAGSLGAGALDRGRPAPPAG